MASKRETVTLPGRLVRMGHDVSCGVLAGEVSLPGNEEYSYTQPKIHDVPSDLPDDLYSVTFGGKTQKVRRLKGAWIGPIG